MDSKYCNCGGADIDEYNQSWCSNCKMPFSDETKELVHKAMQMGASLVKDYLQNSWNTPDDKPAKSEYNFSKEVLLYHIEKKLYYIGWYDYNTGHWEHTADDNFQFVSGFVWTELPSYKTLEAKEGEVDGK